MAGHSRWAQIKHRKGIIDQKRGKIFSKLLAAITSAARQEPNQQFNPRLRAAITKAKEHSVSSVAINRAIARARDVSQKVDEFIAGAYSEDGTPVLIMGATDNQNKTIAEIKKIIGDHRAKWAESGGARWLFDILEDGKATAKFPQTTPHSSATQELLGALMDHADVRGVYTANPRV